jgi:hypothetical protein
MDQSTLIGVAGIIAAVGVGYYLSNQKPTQIKQSKASRMQLDQDNVFAAATPALDTGRYNRVLEKAYTTRQAQENLNADLPQLSGLSKNLSAARTLTDIQGRVADIYLDVHKKTNYLFSEDKKHPIYQGNIRAKTQVTNFLR